MVALLCAVHAVLSYGDRLNIDDELAVAHVYADAGSNVSLPCQPQSLRSEDPMTRSSRFSVSGRQLSWIREGKSLQRSRVEANGLLSLARVESKDAGLYVCQVEEAFLSSGEPSFPDVVAQIQLHVKSNFFFFSSRRVPSLLSTFVATNICRFSFTITATPPAPASVDVYPSAFLALVLWQLNGTGGYAVKEVSVIYQKVTDDDDNPSWHRTFPETVAPETVKLPASLPFRSTD